MTSNELLNTAGVLKLRMTQHEYDEFGLILPCDQVELSLLCNSITACSPETLEHFLSTYYQLHHDAPMD